MSIRPVDACVVSMPESVDAKFKWINLLSPAYFIPIVTTLAILFLCVRTYYIVADVDTARQL